MNRSPKRVSAVPPDAATLGQNDAIYRLLVETVRDYAIFVLDPKGYIASWNAGAERITGYTPAEIIGQHFSRFYSAEDNARGKWRAELDAATRDGRVEDVGWRVRKDGSKFWATVVITTLRDASGSHVGFAKVTRDLTESTYRRFIEATNAIVWTMDAGGLPNADSPSWREFTGQSEHEWRGGKAWTSVHADDVESLRGAWTKAKADASPFEAEFRLRRRDGTYLWMAARGVPLRTSDSTVDEWFCVTTDISPRKQAEIERAKALQRERIARIEAERSQNWWTTTLRSIGDGVIATDARGCVRFMNPVAEALTGWTLQDAQGHVLGDIFVVVNEETRRHVESPVDRVLREGVIVGLANHTVLVRTDGINVPIHDSAAPIRDVDGSLHGVVLVFRDVSDEKLAAARREPQTTTRRRSNERTARTRKTTNKIFATPAALAAIPPKPKTAATIAMTKKTAAQ